MTARAVTQAIYAASMCSNLLPLDSACAGLCACHSCHLVVVTCLNCTQSQDSVPSPTSYWLRTLRSTNHVHAVALQQRCFILQTLLEHVMRDLRADQRALKRLAALPGEENRVGFTNMIKVRN